MGTDRTWKLSRKHPFTTMFDGPKLELGETVSVVELSRLREAEAELADARAELEDHVRQVREGVGDWRVAEARAERLEAELREAREALAFYADPERWIADGSVQTPGNHPMSESPAGVDRGDRARGVLEKGDKG